MKGIEDLNEKKFDSIKSINQSWEEDYYVQYSIEIPQMDI